MDADVLGENPAAMLGWALFGRFTMAQVLTDQLLEAWATREGEALRDRLSDDERKEFLKKILKESGRSDIPVNDLVMVFMAAKTARDDQLAHNMNVAFDMVENDPKNIVSMLRHIKRLSWYIVWILWLLEALGYAQPTRLIEGKQVPVSLERPSDQMPR